jgi:subtilase family serine protease
MKRPRCRGLRPALERLDERWLPSGLTAAQVIQAYGLNNITFNNGTIPGNGSGETIALIEAYHDPDLVQNVTMFDTSTSMTGLSLGNSTSFLHVVTLGGTSNAGWAGEEEADVEVAHAIALGANIDVVEAKSDSIQDLMAAVNVAKQIPGVSVVSMSWGGSEFQGETAYDSIFTTPLGHIGITFIAAAGDTPGAEWPASSPYVLSVGGTTLRLNSSGGIASETTWSNSGGGTSLIETEPTYQIGVQSTGRRSTPDVTFDGDPYTGINLYTTYTTNPYSSTGQAYWLTTGGTSIGAPAWAGIIAIVNQGLQDAGKPVLDSSGPTQTMTDLYSLANSSAYNTVAPAPSYYGFFFFRSRTPTATSAALGSPDGSALISDLVSDITPSSSNLSHATTVATGSSATSGGHSVHVVKTSPKKPVRSHPPVGHGRAGLHGGSLRGVFEGLRSKPAFG